LPAAAVVVPFPEAAVVGVLPVVVPEAAIVVVPLTVFAVAVVVAEPERGKHCEYYGFLEAQVYPETHGGCARPSYPPPK